jgi:hypothetical protein
MVENLRKAEFDAAQPVRNKETGKIVLPGLLGHALYYHSEARHSIIIML